MEGFVDWLQFTVDSQDVYSVCIQYLNTKFSNFYNLKKGMQGYKSSYTYNKILLLSEGNLNMGIHIIMSSSAIALFSAKNNFFRLIEKIIANQCKVSRLDIAIDDYNARYLKLDLIKKDIAIGCVVSRWRSYSNITKNSLKDNSLEGETLYFGSRTSDIFMRIYRKDLEQKIFDPLMRNWTRLELELKKEKAYSMLSEIHRQININKQTYFTEKIHSLLNHYIRFLKKGKGKNKSRWETSVHWENFISNTNTLKLSVPEKEYNLNDVKRWVYQQVSTSLAMILEDNGGDVNELIMFAEDGRDRFKEKHYKMIADSKLYKEQLKKADG